MPLNSRYVPGDGPLSSPFWAIGEAPGADEDRAGKPFVGSAGRLLDSALRAADIPRSFLHIDNCFKKRPPNNDVSYYYNDKKKMTYPTEEGQIFIEELRRDLELYRPNLILALGATAMKTLTGKMRITKWRGSLLPCTLVEGLKVYPTFHPSFVMRLMQEKGEAKEEKQAKNVFPIFLNDLKRAYYQCTFPEISTLNRSFKINPTCAETLQWLKEVPYEALVSCDIETFIGANVITRIGFSFSESSAISIPFILRGAPCWTSTEFALLLTALDGLFRRTDLKFIFHNGLFDMLYLARFFHLLPSPGSVEDTMILSHATYPHFPKGLASLTSFFTWEPYYKDEGKQWGVRTGDDALSVYNAKDCAVTREIFPKLLQDCRELGMEQGYRRSLTYLPSLLGMALRGVRCDLQKKAALTEQFTARCEEIDTEIKRLMGRSYKISSAYTQDLVQLLYFDKKYPTQMTNGKISTDANALRRIGKKFPDDPIPRLVVEKKKLLKLISTYTEMEVHEDGRIRTTYDPTGTATWRLSSRESNLGGGGNLQNIPKHPDAFTGLDVGKEIRRLFIPDPGCTLLAADLKQAEAMIVAWLAGELIEINAFLNGDDIHWINTIDILGLPKDLKRDPSSKEHKNMRNMGKTVKHASNYDMGPIKLQAELLKFGFVEEVSACAAMLNRVRASRPMIQHWKASIRSIIDTTRTLTTPLNRKRVFYGRKGDDLYRKAYAFIPQSTVGELACLAIRDIFQDLDATQGLCQVLLNVHDEVVVQCLPSDVKKVAEGIKERMERPLEINGRPLTIPCDFKVGPNWGDMEEYSL